MKGRNTKMAIFEKYLQQSQFTSYEDFMENFKIKVEGEFNFGFDVVDELGRTKPNKPALMWCNAKGEDRQFTFSEMMKYSNKTANYFKELGIKKGDAVMLILKRHYEFWFSIIALHKIGAICIPATDLLTKKDISYRCNAADIKMLVCTSEGNVMDHANDAQASSPTLEIKVLAGSKKNGREIKDGWLSFEDGIENSSDVFERPTGDEAIANEDISLLYFTSGTTGQPKMVAHDYLYPLGHIITASYWHLVEEDGIHLTIADTGWGKAVWGKLYGQWLGETVVFVYDFDKFVPSDMLNIISKYKITTFCAPPTIYRFLIKEDLSQYDLSKLRHCTIAGEPLNPEVYSQFLKITGLKLMEGFGQTETTLSVATFPWMEPKPGSMGRPSPGYDVVITNENNELCADGEVGEIVIRTGKGKPIGMFSEYYRDEDRTKNVWYNDVYHTGDMAWKDEDGYLWYIGRSDDIIKSSGYRIGPFEVESALIEHPAVMETAITGVPDELRGHIVKATVVLAKGYQPSEELKKELQEHVKNVTAPYKYPRIIEFVNELPKTISGKIRRVEIRSRDEEKNVD